MRIALSAVVILLFSDVLATAQPAPYVNVTDYGANPSANAATNAAAIQRAVDYARSIKAIAYVPSGVYEVNAVTSVVLDDNARIEMAADATLVTQPNDKGYDSAAGQYQVFLVVGDNVTIRGGNIVGDRELHDYSIPENPYEFGHGITVRNRFRNISNIVIDNVHIVDCVGDGILLHGQSVARYCYPSNVWITNCDIEDCRRNNLSVVVGQDVYIVNCRIIGAGSFKYGKAGTAPKAGIDVEGDSHPSRVVISSNNFSGNVVASIVLYDGNGITVTNNVLGSVWYQVSSNDVISGNTISPGGVIQNTNTPGIEYSGTLLCKGTRYLIEAQQTFDFTTVGSSDNNPGTEFVATAYDYTGTGDQVRRICENVVVYGNYVSAGTYGIMSSGYTRGIEVAWNYLEGQTTRALHMPSGVAHDNYMANQYVGILCGFLPVELYNNIINGASFRGLSSSSSSQGGEFYNNELWNCGAVPISLSDEELWTLSDNTIHAEAGATPTRYTLSVTSPYGYVTRSPNKVKYTPGETVTLTVIPFPWKFFMEWSGDLTGSDNPTTITMNANKSVTANFTTAPVTYALSVSATNGTVTKTPNQANYTSGQTVTLQATPNAGYTFSGWSGDASGTTNPTTITMNANKSVTAGFTAAPVAYALSVSATNGTVTKTPNQASYTSGQMVTLQATPNTDYTFSGWSGDASGTTNPTTVTMNANKSVTAGFTAVPVTYALSVSAANGAVTKTPNQASYTSGQTVTLQATPNAGYAFSGWSGDASGTTNPTTVTMNTNKSVTAAFVANTYTLSISASNGTVTASPSQATYTHGAVVTLTAAPSSGYSFSSWSGDASGTAASATVTMDGNKSVTAAFTANAYTLSVSASNGTVTVSPSQATYTHGEVVTLTAAPSTGYSFSSWSGDASGTAASTTVTMDTNKSVTAVFTLNTYTLSISSANGTVTKNPNQATYTHGQTVTLTATSATGYSFGSWSGDLSGTVASATITMDGNKSVAAGFTINSYTLDTSAANGSINKNPDKATYTHGETVTLQAVPAEEYNFLNWSGDMAGSTNPATLVMNSNKSVTAAFAANTYTLQTNATNGSVTRTPDQASFTSGATVTLIAVSATGYSFSSWSGDLSGTAASATITMDGNKSVTAAFTANAYTLSVSASNGTVTVSPSRQTYTHGEVVTLTAVPSVGYSFSSWSGGASGTATSTTVTMDANKSVTAAFTLNTYTLSISSANGTVTKNPEKATYNHGETVALTVEPAEGYEFAGWSGDLTGSSNPATLTMTSNRSITAGFTAVSNDHEAPVLFGFAPLAGDIQVPLNSLVLLRITDSGEGVDANAVSIEVNGDLVYSGNVASVSGEHGVCRRVGTPAHYVYAYQPAADFDYDSLVTVTVNAADLADNAMDEQSYSFRTQMRTFGSNHCASWGPEGLDKGGAATACDASGNVWVVWHAGQAGSRDIYLARLTPGAEQFGGAVQLTTNPADQCNPDIAIGPNGKLYVVWQDNRRGNWDIYLRTSADGVTWSSEAEATDFSNDETNPVIAVDARSPSYAYLAWQDNRAGNHDIYVASSSTNFVSKTVASVASTAQEQTGPRIAVDASNAVYLVWTDFRNGNADVYGAASSNGPWTNVAVATGPGSQSAPDVAAEPTGSTLHFVWVSDVGGDDDILYGSSSGLPASPLAGADLIDDTSAADQRTPAIVTAAGAGGAARVFASWQDFRNAADGWDADLYAVEVKAGGETNLFVGDGWTRTNQSDPAIGVDLDGRPYVVWTDDRNAKDDIYFAASTFVEPTPLDVRMVVGATGGTVGVASPTHQDQVSVAIPAGACPYDVTVSIAKIWNLEPGHPADMLPYEFGPSGLQFDAPVTITIPYAVADYTGNPPQPYWYDSMTGTMTQQGITNVEHVALSSTVHALRFQTTHFTPYAVVAAEDVVVPGGGGGGGGGCSLSPATGPVGALEYFVPFTLLTIVMIGIRRKDRRRRLKADTLAKMETRNLNGQIGLS